MKLLPAKYLSLLLIVSLLAACVTLGPKTANRPDGTRLAVEAQPLAVEVQPIAWDVIGDVGPNGAPPVADRGIGGTGAPTAAPAASQHAERGIGGTGIVGLITGFGSVVVDGMEIQYDDAASVDVDGIASSILALRVGQLVAIRAEGTDAAPRATMISVRNAVAGRIEAMDGSSGTLTVAGQAVLISNGTQGASHFGLEDWVTVSGLRREDGTIVASRLDVAPAGMLLVRGRVVRDGDVVRVGNLVLSAPMVASVKDGQFVTVSRDYTAGHERVQAVAPDTLFPDHADYFGPSVNRVVVQAFVRVSGGFVSIDGVKVRAERAVSGQARPDGMAIVSLERGQDGSYSAVGLRYTDDRGPVDRPFREEGGAGRNGSDPIVTPAAPMPAPAAPPADALSNPHAMTRAVNGTPPVRTPSAPGTVTGPLVTVTAPPEPATVTAPPAAATVIMPSPGGPPTVERQQPGVSSTGQLISGENSRETDALVRWDRPGPRGVVASHPPRHKVSGSRIVRGSTSTPPLNLLTGAVTSVETKAAGTAPSKRNAIGGSGASSSAELGRVTPTIDTTSGKDFGSQPSGR